MPATRMTAAPERSRSARLSLRAGSIKMKAPYPSIERHEATRAEGRRTRRMAQGSALLNAKKTAERRQLAPSATSEICQRKVCGPGVAKPGCSKVSGGDTLPGHQPARSARTLLMAPHGFSAQ